MDYQNRTTVIIGAASGIGRAQALVVMIDAARENQQEYLHPGLDDTIDHLPRVVRGTARKILAG